MGVARRCGRRTSNRAGAPSGLVIGGRLCFALALLDVTKGGVFWIVALGPARWAIRALRAMGERASCNCVVSVSSATGIMTYSVNGSTTIISVRADRVGSASGAL